jgi:DNA-binding NarL/FixJ family response regulator
VQKFKAAIGWASAESGHACSREFVDLLANYLAAEHFAFIIRETRFHHSLEKMSGSLTNRQNEILHLVRLGMTNKVIAQEMLVSEATVHHEVTRIFKVFSVNNRAELIHFINTKDDFHQLLDEPTG